ncbi:DUF3293 domain-containing protein [bacterium]|nr:MAG: DUF3293 domain-containing protein [bacterium]
MIGTILGDIVGSTRELRPIKTTDFVWLPKGSSFTDDTILSCATLDSIMNQIPFDLSYKKWGNDYPNPKGGYGNNFKEWLQSENSKPYESKGNGAPMRISSIGWLNTLLENCLQLVEDACNVTHNHPDSLDSAKAVVEVIWRLNHGEELNQAIHKAAEVYQIDISKSLAELRPDTRFDLFAKPTVSAVFHVLLESTSVESTIRNAVSLGGDSDTIASIAGSIAEAAFEMKYKWVCQVLSYTPQRISDLLFDVYHSERFFYKNTYDLNILSHLKGYKNSRYEIHWNDGVESVALDGKLRTNKTSIAILTAQNPESTIFTQEENEQRNECLKKDLLALGCQFVKANSSDPSGNWLPEVGFAVIGLTKQQSVELAKKYNQNAIVYLEEGMPAELVWCR